MIRDFLKNKPRRNCFVPTGFTISIKERTLLEGGRNIKFYLLKGVSTAIPAVEYEYEKLFCCYISVTVYNIPELCV
jgi:hypothetical protein